MPAVVAMCQIESSNYRTWINLPLLFIWACFYTSVESDTCIPAMRVCSLRRKFRTILKTSEKLISTLRLQTSTQLAFLEWECFCHNTMYSHAYQAFDIEYEINRIPPRCLKWKGSENCTMVVIIYYVPLTSLTKKYCSKAGCLLNEFDNSR